MKNWSGLRNSIFPFFVGAIVTALSTSVVAQDSEKGPELFKKNTRLPVTINIDLAAIEETVRLVKKGKLYLDQLPNSAGTITYRNDLGVERSFPIKVKARGASRLHYCPIPMLKLGLDRDTTLDDVVFEKIKNLKLVLPCPQFELERDDEAAPRWVAREKVLYELYETITPYHYKTRMLDLTLLNKGKAITLNYNQNGRKKTFSFNHVDAFFIEPDGLVEDRSENLKELDIGDGKWSYRKIDLESWNNLAMFNYAVGNGDLDVEKEVRNVKLFVNKNSVAYNYVQNDEGKQKKEIDINSVRTAIPFLYDLDYSEEGVHFAGPFNPDKRSTIKGPLYTEFHCQTTNTHLERTAQIFLSKKEEFRRIIRGSSWINAEEKEYLENQLFTPFFYYISSPDNLRRIVKKYSADC